eukprot:Platyproteum_vivax@DN2066_c0_g1_i2.p1
MKWFSAVVLSLLFCFVTSLKSRAIRAHLKNVSAHGEAMRARTTTINLPSSPSKLKKLQDKLFVFKTKTDKLKEKLDDRNAYVTIEYLAGKLSKFYEEGADIVEDIRKVQDPSTKGELDSYMYGVIETIA